MITKQIRRVSIEFEDGVTECVEVPKDQGFYRERYTYEQTEDHKVTNRLYVYEIFWTRKEPI